MKYALIDDPTPYSGSKKRINIGDYFQMNVLGTYIQTIMEEKMVLLKMEDLRTYEGEEIILPIQWSPFYPIFMEGDKIAISPTILPLFVSVHLSAEHKEEYFNPYNIAYLKVASPIGCRDEVTKDVLRSYGIESYLVGCVTHLLPHNGIKGNKTFVIDAPLEIKDLIAKYVIYRTGLLRVNQEAHYAA